MSLLLFYQLAELLDAGLPLVDALTIMMHQMPQSNIQTVLMHVRNEVRGGSSLTHALSLHPHRFDNFVVQILSVGEESGNMVQALQALCAYLHARQEFMHKVRSALLVPVISIIFLCGTMLFTFLVIMPRFATLFASFGQELPWLTSVLMSISLFISSWYALALALGIFLFASLGYWYTSFGTGRRMYDWLVLKIPFIGSTVQLIAYAQFFRSTSLLLRGGMPLVPALRIACTLTDNSIVQECFEHITDAVAHGVSLSDALQRQQELVFNPDVIALILIGQETGRLERMLTTIADSFTKKVHTALTLYITLVQPLMMIILGLLVALVTFAIYAPLLQMSTIVQ